VLADRFPGLAHSAAMMGPGSEVLGYDTDRSTDHDWGPRVLLFVERDERAPVGADVMEALSGGAVVQRVEVHEAGEWFTEVLGFDPARGVDVVDWLATPTQLLLAATAGEVFHDELRVLGPRRDALAWYPHDLWLYLIGCQWRRIAQEESFVGRAGEVRDDLGSRIVAARVARDLMRLCFLLERRYAPYSKWLGSAFGTLRCAPDVGPHLTRALAATGWQRREAEIGFAAEKVGEMHNALGLTERVDPTVRPFHGRPFLVLDGQRFADAAFAAIDDRNVGALVPGVGAVDQWVDNTDVLSYPPRARAAVMGVHRYAT
jgi:hypothetical protein